MLTVCVWFNMYFQDSIHCLMVSLMDLYPPIDCRYLSCE